VETGTRLAEPDRVELVEFVVGLQRLLERLVYRRPLLMPPEVAELLTEAWQELEAQGRFDTAVEQIRSGEFDLALIEHGLFGDQLRLKLGLSRRRATAVAEEELRPLRRPKLRKRILLGALGAANVVFGSLAQSIPGGGVIKEFKDASEAALGEPTSWVSKLRALRRPRIQIPEPVDGEEAGA
jgi:hypothetical protein